MIPEHESKALEHSRILEFHKFFSEYHIWLEVGSDRFRMKIRIFETGDGRFCFVQSHHVKLPHHTGEPTMATSIHAEPHLALSTAIESITTYYESATSSGLEPSMDWFVPNDGF